LPARDTDDQALAHDLGAITIADGARLRRTIDRFVLHARGAASPTVLVARLSADAPVEVEMRVGAASVGSFRVLPGGWTEENFEIPQHLFAESMTVSLVARGGGNFGSAHYWLYRHREREDAAK
jgi:hypothetical protein